MITIIIQYDIAEVYESTYNTIITTRLKKPDQSNLKNKMEIKKHNDKHI